MAGFPERSTVRIRDTEPTSANAWGSLVWSCSGSAVPVGASGASGRHDFDAPLERDLVDLNDRAAELASRRRIDSSTECCSALGPESDLHRSPEPRVAPEPDADNKGSERCNAPQASRRTLRKREEPADMLNSGSQIYLELITGGCPVDSEPRRLLSFEARGAGECTEVGDLLLTIAPDCERGRSLALYIIRWASAVGVTPTPTL
ncbi:hypothetical protein [Paraliomyxa miuraensis]|uniref:hypothetical protein n=1 Tax=Paraliomyxa miuraensis TaxID=376150 RepID=UPI00224CBF4A|nr:hypothetical protein [Paraliomyxa miuraensis]MCX4239069.1 hypothetical protein [Paraliomyxa miuraensis]